MQPLSMDRVTGARTPQALARPGREGLVRKNENQRHGQTLSSSLACGFGVSPQVLLLATSGGRRDVGDIRPHPRTTGGYAKVTTTFARTEGEVPRPSGPGASGS